jgi:nucleoside-diphosphate-sugar epimerase
LPRAGLRLGFAAAHPTWRLVTDTANAYLKLAEAENVRFGEAYNMGSGIATATGSVAGLVGTFTGCDKPIVEDHDRKRPKKSEVFELLASNERLTTVSDWFPQVTLLDGLKRTVKWWRKALAQDSVRRDKDYLV